MEQIIKITETNGKKAVSARELHSYLESKKDFSDWIKHRITKYELAENQDYVVVPQKGENLSGGRPTIEYALTIDAAKELSMVEGNAKGKQARKYFIECEKELKQAPRILSYSEMMLESAKLHIEHEKKIAALEQKVNNIIEVQANNEAELKALPVSKEIVPEISLRDKVRLLVNKYAMAKNMSQQHIYENIYTTLYYNYHVAIRSIVKIRKDESLLEVAERKGHLNKIYDIASKLVSTTELQTV